MAASPMSYSELPSPDELRPWIHSFWLFKVEEGAGEIDHRIPLTGAGFITASVGTEPVFIGPRTAPLSTLVRGGDQFWGVHFFPGGARSFFRLDAGSHRDATLPLRILGAECAPAPSADEGLSRLGEVIVRLARNADQPDPAVRAAVAEIIASRGAARISTLVRQSGLSARHFRRRFNDETGLSPKELARVRRVRAAASSALDGQEWVDVASDGGFSDQPHLAREFQSLLGAGPEVFRRHALRIRHELLE